MGGSRFSTKPKEAASVVAACTRVLIILRSRNSKVTVLCMDLIWLPIHFHCLILSASPSAFTFTFLLHRDDFLVLAGPDPCLLVKLSKEAGSRGRSPSAPPWARSPGFAQIVHSPTFCQLASFLQGPSPILCPSLPSRVAHQPGRTLTTSSFAMPSGICYLPNLSWTT